MLVKVNKNYFKTKALLDRNSHALGMMNRKFDESFDCLLFIMEGKEQSFWMKNCIIPLDIIMVNNNLITTIHHNCQPCNEEVCPNYEGYGNIVMELRGGTCEKLGIEEGDFVQYIF